MIKFRAEICNILIYIKYLYYILLTVSDGRSFSTSFKTKFEKLIRFEYENLINDDGPWRTICHGDYVINNVMFTKNQMKLIDMQMVCYCSVGIDLTNFIYISTDREFREKHLNSLLHLYNEEFSQNLMKLTNFTRGKQIGIQINIKMMLI